MIVTSIATDLSDTDANNPFSLCHTALTICSLLVPGSAPLVLITHFLSSCLIKKKNRLNQENPGIR